VLVALLEVWQFRQAFRQAPAFLPAVLLELQWKFQTNWESVTVPGQN
jgi:hypothetical protein